MLIYQPLNIKEINELIIGSLTIWVIFQNKFEVYVSVGIVSLFVFRYANRAKNIKNKATINEDPKDALLREFQNEIEKLKKQLADGNIKWLVLSIYLFLAWNQAVFPAMKT